MRALAQDIRYACRTFARTPGFTAAAILSLALGVGANTSIFSVTSALLLRPLPYQDAGRLVILWNRSPGLGITEDWFSTAQYFDIRNSHAGFEQVAIAIGGNFNLTGDGEPRARRDDPGVVEPAADARRPRRGRPPVRARTMMCRALPAPRSWGTARGRGRYGGDPAVVGRPIVLNGQSYQIVGVLPASFSLPREVMPTLNGAEDADVLLPLPLGPEAAQMRGREDYNVIGKLKRGVSIAAGAGGDGRHHRAPARRAPGRVSAERRAHVQHRRRCRNRSSETCGAPSWCCPSRSGSCCSSRAPTSRTCCCRARSAGRRSLACAPRSARAGSRLVRQLLTESLLLGLAGGVAGLALLAVESEDPARDRREERAAARRDFDRYRACCSSRWRCRWGRRSCSASRRRCACGASICTPRSRTQQAARQAPA